MLFELMNDRVWEKSMKDTSGLNNFFLNNSDKYTSDTIAKVKVYSSEEKEIIEKAKYLISKDKSDEEIKQLLIGKDQIALKIEETEFEKGSNKVPVNFVFEHKDQLLTQDDDFLFVLVKKILPPSVKELKEIRGAVVLDYQKELEKNWIDSLKNKYEVEINEKTVETIIKK